MKKIRHEAFSSAPEQGFVMVMTLVLLAIMGVSAALTVKLSITSDMIGTNLRHRALAFQAAEAALRYCEEQVINNPGQVRVLAGAQPRQEWLDEGKWDEAAITPPRDALGLVNSIKVMPQCLIRHFTLDEWREISPPTPGTVTVESRGFDPQRMVLYRISARGFSPDFVKAKRLSWKDDYDYQSAVGSEVRLQSMIRAMK